MAKHHGVAADARRWEQWFALLGGAAAWTTHLLLAYIIAEFGCVAGWGRLAFLGVSIVAWMLVGVSLLAVGVAVFAAVVAYRLGQRSPGATEDPSPLATPGYMARLGLITSGLFAFIILVESIPIYFYLEQC